MKIAPLLAQFLYTHHRLDLPGIGSFQLDPSGNADAEQGRQGKPVLLEGVSFEFNNLIKQSPELIAFIAGQTGKIKALAAADLDSHLELAKQFLNIGKPFLFEGIGSLTKMQGGGFSFSPGQVITTDKLKEAATAKDTAASITTEEPASDYRSIFYAKKTKANWKKPAAIFLLLAGIVFAVWGGYKVYKKTMARRKSQQDTEKNITTSPIPPVPDTTSGNTVPAKDSSAVNNTPVNATVATIAPAGNYKFVVETAPRIRALARFKHLNSIGVKTVQMETADSLTFKIYFMVPATSADTARILDSLKRNYTPAGKNAYVDVR